MRIVTYLLCIAAAEYNNNAHDVGLVQFSMSHRPISSLHRSTIDTYVSWLDWVKRTLIHNRLRQRLMRILRIFVELSIGI